MVHVIYWSIYFPWDLPLDGWPFSDNCKMFDRKCNEIWKKSRQYIPIWSILIIFEAISKHKYFQCTYIIYNENAYYFIFCNIIWGSFYSIYFIECLLGVHWVVSNVISSSMRSDFWWTQIVSSTAHIQFDLGSQVEKCRCQVTTATPFSTYTTD